MNVTELAQQALKLTADERQELVDLLMPTLEELGPEIEHAWLDEAERRLATYREGHIEGVPLEEALGKLN